MHRTPCLLLLACLASPAPALAVDEIGMRAATLDSGGTVVVLTGRRVLDSGWFVEAGLSQRHYSSRSRTRKVVSLLGGTGRYYPLPRGDQAIFWRAAIGAGVPSMRAGNTDWYATAASEVQLSAAAGLVQRLGEHWRASLAIEHERQFVDRRLLAADGRLADRQTSLSATGISLSLSYRF